MQESWTRESGHLVAMTADGEDAIGSRWVLLAQHYSSPLPPPEVLEHYGEIIADAPERFFCAWEEEGRHRRSLERERLNDRRRTQRYALLLALAVLGAAVYFVSQGQEVAGTSVLLGEVIALAALFLGGRLKGSKRHEVPSSPAPSPAHPESGTGTGAGTGG